MVDEDRVFSAAILGRRVTELNLNFPRGAGMFTDELLADICQVFRQIRPGLAVEVMYSFFRNSSSSD